MGTLELNARIKGLVSKNDVTNAYTEVVSPEGVVNANAMQKDVLQQATVTLTSAQVKALFTTPVTVIAAPGAGSFLEHISTTLIYEAGSTPYTIGSATNLALRYTDGSGQLASATVAVTGFLDDGSSNARVAPPSSSSYEPVNDASIVLTLGGANVTVGDGELTAKVLYRVHKI